MDILTYPLPGIDYDSEDTEIYNCTRTSGVFSDDDEFSASVTGLRTITIGPGLAWIQNEDYHGKAILSREALTLDIEEADANQARIDRIVLRFDKQINASEILVLTGTPASDPAPPDITRDTYVYDLGLYTVRVNASTVNVTDEDISCTFLDEAVCGIMADAVSNVPTQELYDQWLAWFDRVKGQLSEDVAGNLQNEIDNLIKYGTSLPTTGNEGEIFLLLES